MKIKLGSNKILLLIIAALVIYMLFFSNTSGYSNRDAYKEGYSDSINKVSQKSQASFVRAHAKEKKPQRHYGQYKAGFRAGENDLKKSLRGDKAAKKRVNDARRKGTTTVSSGLAALKSTFSPSRTPLARSTFSPVRISAGRGMY